MESLNINVVIDNVIDNIFNFFKRIDRVVIILVDSKSGKISKAVYRFRNSKDDPKNISWYVVKRVLKYENPILIANIQEAEGSELLNTLKLSKIGSVICFPLVSQSEIYGAIYMDSIKRPYGFRKKDISLLGDLSYRASLAIETALLYQNL